jgi:membrane-bound ClpP family serine protease
MPVSIAHIALMYPTDQLGTAAIVAIERTKPEKEKSSKLAPLAGPIGYCTPCADRWGAD